jgi:hypothetical protein
MRKIYLSSLAILACTFLFAQTFESFNFDGALNANGWTTHSGAVPGQFQVLTTPSNSGSSLSYSGLQNSIGNRAIFIAGNTEDVNKAISGISGVGYLSFLMNVTNADTLSTTGVHFIGFGGAAGTSLSAFAGRVYVKKGLSPNTFQLGILNYTGGTPSPTPNYLLTEFPAGTTLLVVIKLNNTTSPIQASLFVNPVPGSAEPIPTIESSLGTSIFNSFASVYLRHGTGIRNVEIDEIRVGSSWESVTPVPCDLPAPNFQDIDADGFGNPDVVQFSCIPILGFVSNNTDCNDNNNQVYPNATEILGNGIDENCDGVDGILNLVDILNFESDIIPNPSNGAFIIRFNTSVNEGDLIFTDINGKIVLSGKIAGSIFEFNDVNLKKGVYFLSIKSSIGSANKRVIIN